MPTSVRAVCDDLADLVGRSSAGPDFGAAVAESLHAVLPFDGWCLFGLDPATVLRTFQFGGRGTEHTAEMARNEACQDDVNKYADLGRSAVPAGWLARDHPRAGTSFRFNEIIRPQGFHSELRLALTEDEHVWGAICLFRDHPRRTFGPPEVTTATALARPLARALRRFPGRPFACTPPPLDPGVILVSPDNRLVAVSEEARAWLQDLVPGGRDETLLDDVTRVVFDSANAVRTSRGAGSRRARTVLRTVSGRWMWVQGTPIASAPADVAVMLQAATTRQLVGPVAAINGLTSRERTVFEGVVRGLATKQIARELGLSPLTVNDHLKAIYRKCGAAGRQDLLGQLA